ncbi:hypothetical protein ACSF4L_005579, partial [Escherichia coli]
HSNRINGLLGQPPSTGQLKKLLKRGHCVIHNFKQLRSLLTKKFHQYFSTQVAEDPLSHR